MNTKREKIEQNRETIKGKCQQMKWNESGFRPPLCTYRLNWARRTFWGWLRWLRWHCPPDTGFEIRALAVWGRARYLSVTEAPHNTDWKCQHDMLKHITRRFLRRSDRQTTSLTLTTGVCKACTKWRGCEHHEYSLWRHRLTDCGMEVTLRSNCLASRSWAGKRGVLNS